MVTFIKCIGTISQGDVNCKDMIPYLGKRLYTYYQQQTSHGEVYHCVCFAVVPLGEELTDDNVETYKVKDIVGLGILATCDIYKAIRL